MITITINTIQSDVPTRNGRIYPKEVMKQAVAIANEKIKNDTFFVVNSENPEPRINMNEVQLKITDCKLTEDGRIEIVASELKHTKGIEELLNRLSHCHHVEFVPKFVGDLDDTGKITQIDDFTSVGIRNIPSINKD